MEKKLKKLEMQFEIIGACYMPEYVVLKELMYL